MASPVAESSRQLIVDTQQALTSSRLAVATLRAKLRHTTPVPQPAAPGNQARPVVVDPWLELEAVIDRLARLVIHAQALADRTAALPAIVEAADRHRRADHLRLLRAAVDLGQRAITAAAAITCQPGRCRIMRTPQQIDALRPEGDLRNAAAVRAAAYRRSCWTTRPRTLESQQSAESAACGASLGSSSRPTDSDQAADLRDGRVNAIFAASSASPDLSPRAGCSAAVRSIVAAGVGCGRRPEPRARPVVAPRGVGQRAVLALDEPPVGGQSPRPLPRKRHQPRPCRRRQRSRCALGSPPQRAPRPRGSAAVRRRSSRDCPRPR